MSLFGQTVSKILSSSADYDYLLHETEKIVSAGKLKALSGDGVFDTNNLYPTEVAKVADQACDKLGINTAYQFANFMLLKLYIIVCFSRMLADNIDYLYALNDNCYDAGLSTEDLDFNGTTGTIDIIWHTRDNGTVATHNLERLATDKLELLTDPELEIMDCYLGDLINTTLKNLKKSKLVEFLTYE